MKAQTQKLVLSESEIRELLTVLLVRGIYMTVSLSCYFGNEELEMELLLEEIERNPRNICSYAFGSIDN
jgi:hypothetical protein